jgi:hypothetical protein
MAKRTKILTKEMRAYFRELGQRGGRERAKKLTAANRKRIGQQLAQARRRAARLRKAGKTP